LTWWRSNATTFPFVAYLVHQNSKKIWETN